MKMENFKINVWFAKSLLLSKKKNSFKKVIKKMILQNSQKNDFAVIFLVIYIF